MADNGFNGSTLTFNGTACSLGNATNALLSMNHTKVGTPVDVSGAGSVTKEFVMGLIEDTFECEVVGTPGIDPSATSAALVMTWEDGETDSCNAICIENSISGSVDGAITSKLAFKVSGY